MSAQVAPDSPRATPLNGSDPPSTTPDALSARGAPSDADPPVEEPASWSAVDPPCPPVALEGPSSLASAATMAPPVPDGRPPPTVPLGSAASPLELAPPIAPSPAPPPLPAGLPDDAEGSPEVSSPAHPRNATDATRTRTGVRMGPPWARGCGRTRLQRLEEDESIAPRG